jgi:HAD superfamily hydrolase (TIGR01509 family)
VRQALIDAVRCQPRRILDLDCGTGSMTLMLKQAFPGAEVIGLDLSPYMLVMAEYKAKKAGPDIQWRHGNAERTGFPDACFDLVAASLLFHETPHPVSQAIVRESFRLLTTGGEIVVLDGNQKTLRQMDWLNDIFEEPQIKAYAACSVGAWMGAAGFGAVRTEDIWWVHQVSHGVKPISASDSPASAARGVWQTTDTPAGGDERRLARSGVQHISMTLKAVLFDFNGVIINDEPIHERLLEQLLIEENLRPKRGEFRQFCLGRSDRACIADLLAIRGRIVSESYLAALMVRKAQAYQEYLQTLDPLPVYAGLEDFILKLRGAGLAIALVTGALRLEVEEVLRRVGLAQYFPVIVAGDDITASKPEPDGYLLAVDRLNQFYPELKLQSRECLAIEDTPAGIQAAKRAGMQVVGVANTYPLHMLQRQANWAVDFLADLELERVRKIFDKQVLTKSVGEC